MATVSVNGISIAFDDRGSGDDVLVLVHGHPFNRSMWQPQLDAIAAAGWRAIAPDLRGYGQTELVKPPHAPAGGVRKTTLDMFANDLVALLDHLGIRQVVACGLSMGGQIVMELARSHASRIRGLILAATFPRQDTEAGQQARRDMADRLEREGMSGYAEDVLPKMVAPQNIVRFPDVAAHVTGMMKASNPQGAAAALRGRAERPPYEPTLRDLAVPALVVVGDDDAFTTKEDVASMESLIERVSVVRIPDVGHMPNLEATAAFNDAVITFLRNVPRASL